MTDVSPSSPPREARLEALMGIRYVAAVSVVLSHLGWLPFVAVVPLFFVLSGFILTYKYVRADGLAVDVRTFWIARLSRIYPAHLLALGILVAINALVGVDILRFLGSLTSGALMLNAWSPRWVFAWNIPSWTNSDELFFYLCFPLLIPLALRLSDRRSLLCGMGVAWVAGMTLTWYVAHDLSTTVRAVSPGGDFVKYNPVVHLPEFAIGMLLGRWYAIRGGHADRRRGALLSTTALLLAMLLTFAPDWAGLYHYLHNTMLTPLFAVMIWGLTLGGGMAIPLSTPRLVLLGHASYAVYILQQPVFTLFRIAFGERACEDHPLVVPVLVGVLTLIGIAVHRFIEEPFMRAARASLQRRLVPERTCTMRVAKRESLVALVILVFAIAETSLLPQRVAVLAETRLEKTLASVGQSPVAWVANGDERYIDAYVERLPWISFVPYDKSRVTDLVLARPTFRDGVHTRLVDVEPHAWVALWCRPDTPLPPAYRFTEKTVFGNRRKAFIRESGLHETESDASGLTWRWTDGHATLDVPWPAYAPHHLLLRLGVARSTRLEVRVDGKTAWTGFARSDGGFMIPIRPEMKEPWLRLELVSETFVPHALDPKSGDTRTLGVSVFGLQVLP